MNIQTFCKLGHSQHHNIIAAVLIKDAKLVQDLLARLLQADEWKCKCFGSPLYLAVAQKDKETVHTILQWLEEVLEHGTVAPTYISSDDQRFDVLTAIEGAFVEDNLDVLQALLSFYSKRFGPSGRSLFDYWLRMAHRIANPKYVRAVLEVAKRGRAILSHEGLVHAMRYSESNHINTLIAIKVRGGKLDSIRAILDAGANVNFVVSPGWFPFSAMTIAFRTNQKQEHKVRIVQLLLDRRATFPAVQAWPEAGKPGTSKIRAFLEAEQKKRKGEDLEILKL